LAKLGFFVRIHTVGLNAERAAELTGVPVDVIHQRDQDGAPEMAEKLLMLWDRKHVGHEGWNGFLFSRGVLRFKNRRWTAKMILELSATRKKKSMHSETNWSG
jgi:hypothetical protein